MSITFDKDSPERGWPPFVDWLASLGVRPGDVVRVTIFSSVKFGDSWKFHDPLPMAEIEMKAYDRDGNRAIDLPRGTLCTYTRGGRVKPPPLHPSRSEDAA